jgi:hypothetical protein
MADETTATGGLDLYATTGTSPPERSGKPSGELVRGGEH